MKSSTTVNLTLLLTLAAISCACLHGEQAASVDRVVFKDAAVWGVKDGATLLLTNEVSLPRDIKVMTNGTFRVKEGKERHFAEGQVLGADGMLISPDGTIKPVFDHVGVVAGKPVIMKDGEVSPLQADTDLPEAGRITPEGYLIDKSGARRKLLDGEIIDLNGQAIPASDTVILKDGRVMVQKDGASMEVAPGRNLMMNDGSKVFGNGTIVMKDGTRRSLVPDEILKLEGVKPANR